MAEAHDSIRFLNDKRRVLVVDDEPVNRELLGMILKDSYDVVFAKDGAEALETLREQRDLISLVLLDLLMPNIPGMEVLHRIRIADEYQDIPVIVASADLSQEIQCLNIGASDFIQKPYPEPGIILARVRRAIELFETRKTLQSAERDPLTGLFNREFFTVMGDSTTTTIKRWRWMRSLLISAASPLSMRGTERISPTGFCAG